MWNTFYLQIMINRGKTPAVADGNQNVCGIEAVGVEIYKAACKAAMDS